MCLTRILKFIMCQQKTQNEQQGANFISVADVRGGDILLCYSASSKKSFGSVIKNVTKSNYTHAAIALDQEFVAESIPLSGIAKTKTPEFVARYDHVAVFRAQPGIWTPRRLAGLNDFIFKLIDSAAKYNFIGIASYIKDKNKHELSVHDKLESHFNGGAVKYMPDKNNYFCSELVVACFIATDILSSSAAIVYDPKIFSPGELGKDNGTFGFFVGYISFRENYKVNNDDDFINATKLNEVWK